MEGSADWKVYQCITMQFVTECFQRTGDDVRMPENEPYHPSTEVVWAGTAYSYHSDGQGRGVHQ